MMRSSSSFFRHHLPATNKHRVFFLDVTFLVLLLLGTIISSSHAFYLKNGGIRRRTFYVSSSSSSLAWVLATSEQDFREKHKGVSTSAFMVSVAMNPKKQEHQEEQEGWGRITITRRISSLYCSYCSPCQLFLLLRLSVHSFLDRIIRNTKKFRRWTLAVLLAWSTAAAISLSATTSNLPAYAAPSPSSFSTLSTLRPATSATPSTSTTSSSSSSTPSHSAFDPVSTILDQSYSTLRSSNNNKRQQQAQGRAQPKQQSTREDSSSSSSASTEEEQQQPRPARARAASSTRTTATSTSSSRSRNDFDYFDDHDETTVMRSNSLLELKRNLLRQGMDPYQDLEGHRQVHFLQTGIDLARIPGSREFVEHQLEQYPLLYRQSLAYTRAPQRQLLALFVQDLAVRGIHDPVPYFASHPEVVQRIYALSSQEAHDLVRLYQRNLERHGRIASFPISVINALERAMAESLRMVTTSSTRSQITENAHQHTTIDNILAYEKEKAPSPKGVAVAQDQEYPNQRHHPRSRRRFFSSSTSSKEEQSSDKRKGVEEQRGLLKKDEDRPAVADRSGRSRIRSSDGAARAPKDGSGARRSPSTSTTTSSSKASSKATGPSATWTAQSPKSISSSSSFSSSLVSLRKRILTPALFLVLFVGGGGALAALLQYLLPSSRQQKGFTKEEQDFQQLYTLLTGDLGSYKNNRSASSSSSSTTSPLFQSSRDTPSSSHPTPSSSVQGQQQVARTTAGPSSPSSLFAVTPPPLTGSVVQPLSQPQLVSPPRQSLQSTSSSTTTKRDLYDLIDGTGTGGDTRTSEFIRQLAKVLALGAPHRFPHVKTLSGGYIEPLGNAYDQKQTAQFLKQARATAFLDETQALELFDQVSRCMMTDMVDSEASLLLGNESPTTMEAINDVVEFMAHVSSVYDALTTGFSSFSKQATTTTTTTRGSPSSFPALTDSQAPTWLSMPVLAGDNTGSTSDRHGQNQHPESSSAEEAATASDFESRKLLF